MTQPPEAPPRESGGGLSTKVGPLPGWAWIGIAAVAGIGVILWLRSRGSATSAAPGSTVSPDTATVGNLQDQLATIAAQMRDLQGGSTTPTTNTQPTRTVIITGGQSLQDFLSQYSVSLQDFLALNPDIAKYLRTTNASGFGPGGPNSLAFDFGPNTSVMVAQVPLVATKPPLQPINTSPSTNGHALGVTS